MSIRRIPLNVERLPDKISLGRGSENEAVQLAVDVSAWVNAWPACSISINFLRPFEDIFYTVSGTLDGGLYTYEVTDTDTAIAGTGTMELVCTEDGKLAASAVARFVVDERLLGTQSPTPPEPVQSWYTRALQAADDAEDAAERAETAAETVAGLEPRVTALENLEKAAIPYTYGTNNHGVFYNKNDTMISNISRIVGPVDVSKYGKLYYSRRKNANSGSNAGMHFLDADGNYISGERDIIDGVSENAYEMAWIDVPATAKTARFTAFNDTEAYGDFVLYGISKLVATVTDLAENDPVQDATIAANTAAITALDNAKADKVALAHTDRVVSALVEAGKGKILRFEADDDDAYAKTVPSGALNATVTEWGGKSLVLNQLISDGDTTKTIASSSGWASAWYAGLSTVANHKYYVAFSVTDATAGDKFLLSLTSGVNPIAEKTAVAGANRFVAIYTASTAMVAAVTTVYRIFSASENTVHINNVAFIDLTQFGASDITSVDDPRIAAIEAYAAEHPEYNAGEIVSADVNAIITKKADTTTMQTINIPSAVLSAYPLRSAGSVYDTISWDGLKWWHTKNTGKLVIGDKTWTSGNDSRFWTGVSGDNFKFPADGGTAVDALCALFEAVNYTSFTSKDKIVYAAYTTGLVYIKDTAYASSTAAEFKAAMDGVELYYALATPVVTDITDLMGDAGTDLIAMAVESGGTITFAQNGNTIFPVPNKIEYMVKLTEVE